MRNHCSALKEQHKAPRAATVSRRRMSRGSWFGSSTVYNSKVLVLVPVLALLALIGMGKWVGTPAISKPLVEPVATEFPKLASVVPQLEFLSSGTLVHQVKSGETLSQIGTNYGVKPEVVNALDRDLRAALPELVESYPLRSGKSIWLKLGSVGGLEQIVFELSGLKRLRAVTNGESFSLEVVEQASTEVEEFIEGTINSSLAEAASTKGVSYDIIDDLVDVLSSRILFDRDFRKGDRFKLLYNTKHLTSGEIAGSGPLKMASLTVNGERHIAIRHVGADGKARYFDEKGELLGNTFLRYPLKFSRISSQFSFSRFHPVLNRRMPHNGVDFAAPTGTPVRSVANGKVVFAGRKGPNGIMVKVKHSDRYTTAYVHLSRIAKGIRRGVRVERGQTIGAVGSTGRSTGPHLHYSFIDRGKYVNPLKVKLPIAEKLTAKNAIPKAKIAAALERLGESKV